MLTHGELFAGIGGFGIGFDNAGFETKWHVEIDKSCQSVLHRHFPDTQIESDVCEVGKHNLCSVDVISFGSPCQDLSIAGKRKGFQDGTRSNLFFEAIRIVGELKPAFAVWENVPGALSSHSGRDFAAVLTAFRECGAVDIAYRILDAQYFGVPQRRRRIFLVADFRGKRAAEVLFESESMSGDTPTRRKTGEVASTLFASGAGTSRPAGTASETGFLIAQPLRAGRQFSDMGDGQSNLVVGTLQSHSKKHGHAMTTQQAAENNQLITAHSLTSHPTGRNEPSSDNLVWDSAQITSKEHRSKPSEISQPLNTLAGMMVGVRRLTPVECERLQGFPDGWTDGQSDSARYRQLGNAVAVPVVEWIARRIVEVDEAS